MSSLSIRLTDAQRRIAHRRRQGKGLEPFDFVKHQKSQPATYPTCSWWANANGDFYDVAKIAASRMAKGGGVNYSPRYTEWD